ncbi:uncharacterized protein LOC110271321 [Arachis ipaensis]|uniref:uncharacterized protein LOC110271321 n=1 Tax=Arachis ipaensis TaxID=130454 RepID=UPI000A2B1E34|nr:uncharacterized protein LOC110271321 [Arachis ipaensis]
MRIALGAAKGLAYLHEELVFVVAEGSHRRVAPLSTVLPQWFPLRLKEAVAELFSSLPRCCNHLLHDLPMTLPLLRPSCSVGADPRSYWKPLASLLELVAGSNKSKAVGCSSSRLAVSLKKTAFSGNSSGETRTLLLLLLSISCSFVYP